MGVWVGLAAARAAPMGRGPPAGPGGAVLPSGAAAAGGHSPGATSGGIGIARRAGGRRGHPAPRRPPPAQPCPSAEPPSAASRPPRSRSPCPAGKQRGSRGGCGHCPSLADTGAGAAGRRRTPGEEAASGAADPRAAGGPGRGSPSLAKDGQPAGPGDGSQGAGEVSRPQQDKVPGATAPSRAPEIPWTCARAAGTPGTVRGTDPADPRRSGCWDGSRRCTPDPTTAVHLGAEARRRAAG